MISQALAKVIQRDRQALEAIPDPTPRNEMMDFVQVTDGIKHMHEARVMHRDIKPANIFLAANGSVKLGDLGVSVQMSGTLARRRTVIGTPHWLAPEVLAEDGGSFKVDVLHRP